MVQYFTLENKFIKVILSTRGAGVYRLLFDDKDMLVSPKELCDYEKEKIYFGKTIGRICGRIVIDGQTVLHGGPHGLSNVDFIASPSENKVVFTTVSKGDESSKGSASIRITYELIDNELLLTMEASAVEKAKISLTNHAYFCLGESSIEPLSLRFNSSACLDYDEDLIPIGKTPITEKYNFKEVKPVLEYGTIDNYFYLDEDKITLTSKKYRLDIITDFLGTTVFTDHFADGVKTFMTDNDTYRGLAIEPQDDTLARKELLPGESMKRTIRYRFTKV